MNRGFSLLEFMVAFALFSVILLCGYESVTSQADLFHQMILRTKPDAEANYRQLLIKGLISHSSEGFKRDPLAEEAPHVFPDLNFGQNPEADTFSFARPQGDPVRFQKQGSLFRTPATPLWQKDKTVLLAGADSSGSFQWNYARIAQVTSASNQQLLSLNTFLDKPQIESGVLQQVEIWGFSFRTDTLYMISPSGAAQPYFAVSSFRYGWDQSFLTLHWKPNLNEISFMVTP